MLSKKNSRPITAMDQPFRWSVSPDAQYATLVVQHAEVDGQRLEINFLAYIGQPIGDEPFTPEIRMIAPSLVANLIARAAKLGWQPTTKAAPLEMSLSETDELTLRRGLLDKD